MSPIPSNESSAGTTPILDLGSFCLSTTCSFSATFFSSPDQVAWVYDPHTDEEGCFGWIDGDIHRISTFSIVDNNGDGVERTPKEMEAVLPEGGRNQAGRRTRDAPPRGFAGARQL